MDVNKEDIELEIDLQIISNSFITHKKYEL